MGDLDALEEIAEQTNPRLKPEQRKNMRGLKCHYPRARKRARLRARLNRPRKNLKITKPTLV
jgi:hypothetical protein